MSKQRKVLFHVLGHLAGFLGYAAIAFLGGVVYVAVVNHFYGHQQGVEEAVYIALLPIAAGAIGLCLWFPVWIGLWVFGGFARWFVVFVLPAVLTALATTVFCGGLERCFLPGGAERMVGIALVLTVGFAALAHHQIVQFIVRTLGPAAPSLHAQTASERHQQP